MTRARQRKRAALSNAEQEQRRERQRPYFREYRKRWRAANAERDRATQRRWQKANRMKNPEAHRRGAQARRYGLTVAEVDALRDSQGGLCAVCRIPHSKPLQVDHCHATGRVRGMLCGNCNSALGHAKDSVERLFRLIAYLELQEPGAQITPARMRDLAALVTTLLEERRGGTIEGTASARALAAITAGA